MTGLQILLDLQAILRMQVVEVEKRLSGQVASTTSTLAEAQEDFASARDCFEQSLVIDTQIGDRREYLSDRFNLVRLCVHLGDLNDARKHAAVIASIARFNSGPREVGVREQVYGIIALASGDVSAGRQHLLQALNAFAPTQMTNYFVEALRTLGSTFQLDAAHLLATVADDVHEGRISLFEAVALVRSRLSEGRPN